MAVRAIPEGHHTLTPYLTVRGAAAAVEFYVRAFGAREIHRHASPDGRLMHAELRIGDSPLMLADEYPEMSPAKSPLGLGGTPVTLHVACEDVRAAFERAVKAGCLVTFPLQDMFWGDRFGKVVDPFGHEWSLSQHVEDVSPEELERRGAAAFAPQK